MNRTQKKCFIASTGFHLFLLLILFIGPAFLTSKENTEDRPPIDIIPLKTIEAALSGVGNPAARPPENTPLPAQPPASLPAPKLQPETEQTRQPDPPKPPKADPEVISEKPPAKKLPSISIKKVTRSTNDPKQKSTAKSTSPADDSKSQLLAAVRGTTSTLGKSLSSSTKIELNGPGGGGVPYANFLDAVRKIYTDAWLVPDDVTDDSAVATASVTIARDGTVLSSRIIVPSGNPRADHSVEAVLNRVTFAVPLPETAKENQRTVKIQFSVKAKLLG
jgi:TonB family protein